MVCFKPAGKLELGHNTGLILTVILFVTSLNLHINHSLGTIRGREKINGLLDELPELLTSNEMSSFFTLPASNNTGYFFSLLRSTCNLIQKQTACRCSAIMKALVIVRTSLSWYCSIHTGFVIINFLADWMCCIDMYLCNCMSYS